MWIKFLTWSVLLRYEYKTAFSYNAVFAGWRLMFINHNIFCYFLFQIGYNAKPYAIQCLVRTFHSPELKCYTFSFHSFIREFLISRGWTWGVPGCFLNSELDAGSLNISRKVWFPLLFEICCHLLHDYEWRDEYGPCGIHLFCGQDLRWNNTNLLFCTFMCS